MKLGKEEKELLRSMDCEDQDFPQIERALSVNMTTYKMGNKRISREQAIELLGKRDFLSGIARSAFHGTAGRETADGKVVLFTDAEYFRGDLITYQQVFPDVITFEKKARKDGSRVLK